MERLRQDLRYGFRGLIKNPAFTAVAVIAIALGIGATTAIFSVVNAVLFRSLPYNDPERLVVVWEKNVPRNNDRNVVSPGNYFDWVDQNQSFEQMAVIYPDVRANLTGDGDPEELPGYAVSASFLPVLGVEPSIGRNFSEAEDVPGAEQVVILSHNLWQRRFGGDLAVLDKKITLNSISHQIIGVMPPDFNFMSRRMDVLVPLRLDRSVNYRESSGRYIGVIARLKPNVTVAEAKSEMATIAKRLEEQYPKFNTGWSANVVPIHEQAVGDVRTLLLVLFGAVCFVLLIACANVANLMLARAASRQREFAVRVALGAGRWRIVRQLLTESVLLAIVGGAAGLVVAYWGVELLVAFAPQSIPRTDEIGVDRTVLAFSIGVSFLTGIIFGLLPAFQASKPDLNESLKEGGRGSSGGVRSRRIRNAFVVAEVALALMLLIGAGLMIRSFMRLQNVDAGFDQENVLTMRLQARGSIYPEPHQRVAFFKQVHERLLNMPGVESVGATNFMPLTGLRSATAFTIEDRPTDAVGAQRPSTDVRFITPTYFAAMGIPLLEGRLFDDQDVAAGRRVLVISESLAKKYFPGEDPLGKRLIISWDRPPQSDEIIGVVGDVKHMSLDADAPPTIYWPYAKQPVTFMMLAVRTKSDPMNLAAAIRNEIRAIDNEQPVADMRPLTEIVSSSIGRQRFNMLLLIIFAVVAMLLASVGIYGVMSYSVRQRTHEIGIRMALGASSTDVLKMVVGQGMLLTIAGVVIGLLATVVLAETLLATQIRSLLFQTSTTDAITFVVIPLVLSVVALVACVIPARRATKVDPMIALRYE